jgi:hypothetical protein
VQPISGYLYKQIITVVKNNDFAPYRENQLVYARPLQIYKGIDNKFQIIIRNADLKPVSLLDSTVLFNLIDPTSQELVFSRNLTVVYTDTGTATAVIEQSFLDNLNAGLYNYSIVVTNGEGEQQIAYSDDNYNAQGQARINENVYPAFVPTILPTILQYGNNADTNYQNVAYTSSSVVADRVKGVAVQQTVQYNANAFTGNIDLQATQEIPTAINPNSYITINTVTLNNFTGNGYFNFQGKFNAVRFKITQTSGTVNYIAYRP